MNDETIGPCGRGAGSCRIGISFGASLDATLQAALGGTPSPDTRRPAKKPDF
jgi:hypothetical protein